MLNSYSEQAPAKKEVATRILRRHESMVSNRVLWATHWQECMDYIVPKKRDVLTVLPSGGKRGEDLYDSTAILSNVTLAGALHGMLTNPALKFLALEFGDSRLDDMSDVQAWCGEVSDRMYEILNYSNFQTEIYELYIDLGAIGTACMFMSEDKDKVIRFSSRAMKEVYALESSTHKIDIVHREFEWTARQLVQEFGEDALTRDIMERYKQDSQDKFKVLHVVEPKREPADDKYFDYDSYYLLKDPGFMLGEMKGFKEFPYLVPRWSKTAGETYGRSPGMDMLPDIKMVNQMMLAVLQGAQKTVDPPLMVPDDGVIGNIRLTPGGLTVVRPGEQNMIRPLITNARVDFGQNMVEDVRKRIRAGFFIDQLQLDQGPQMTAEEVRQRTQEKLRLMGPILSRQHHEFLSPLVDRLFGIMLRQGLLPEPPRTIQGKNAKVKYCSLIARAQKMSEGQSFLQAMQAITPMAQVKPQLLDNIDEDKATKYLMEVFGVPHKILRSDDQVKQIRDKQAKAVAQAQKNAQEQHQAELVNKMAPGVAQLQQSTRPQAPGG